jgi:heme-degrading monooxygenase HmoA
MTLPSPATGPIITIFRSRLRPDAGSEYGATAERMMTLAMAMPGFVDFKAFVAEDGERLSLITFASLETQEAWRDQAEHQGAQEAGRDRFYAGYSLEVCQLLRESQFGVL